jgi:hypothetical protein
MHAADTLFKPEKVGDFIADAKRPRRRALLCDDAPAITVRARRASGIQSSDFRTTAAELTPRG